MERISALTRQVRISQITDTPNQVLKWFKRLQNRLSMVEVDVNSKKGGEFVYYIIGKKGKKLWVFYYNSRSGDFSFSDTYHSMVSHKFNLNIDNSYKELQCITQELVAISGINTNITLDNASSLNPRYANIGLMFSILNDEKFVEFKSKIRPIDPKLAILMKNLKKQGVI